MKLTADTSFKQLPVNVAESVAYGECFGFMCRYFFLVCLIIFCPLVEKCLKRVKELETQKVRDVVLKRTGAKAIQSLQTDMRPERVKVAILLLPVFLCSYSYRKQVRAVVLAGNNGNLEGEVAPWGTGYVGRVLQSVFDKATKMVHDNF